MPSTTLSWQSNVDIPMRRMMIQKLLWMFQHQQAFQQAMPPGAVDARLPSLVRRLELALYLRAASLDEYLNEHSVQRRVQSLIIALHHQAVLQFVPRPDEEIAFHMAPAVKRYRSDDVDNNENAPAAKTLRRCPPTSFLINSHEDVLRKIFSYLDGRTVFGCMGINRFAAHFLPSCVLYLHLPVHHLDTLLRSAQLARCTELQCLDVFNPSTSTPGDQALQSSEAVVVRLARRLQEKALPKLRRLSLHATFVNTQALNATAALCAALSQCPLLEELVLGGNALGDSGAKEIANSLLRLHCPRLRLLDLRRNYIGEGGIKDLAVALGAIPHQHLRWLLLGSNIAGDAAIAALASALALGHARGLEFLGLEDNFVNVAGVHALAAALKKGVCPALKELCIGDNVVENQVIQDIFAFALHRQPSVTSRSP
ncbi:hypothetical protein ACHHYP_15225 [Achlya hypogyna]|uniref:Uncharacterized protein n=1 Tax=Achlya hypogyna TaxID=1202772 RepID=A0A1V9YBA9_ACHHY|nr:hypothetical protein ACHHYP_15225 [Achlya hypogyna]